MQSIRQQNTFQRVLQGKRGWWFPLLYVGVVGLLALPIVQPSYPPLVDYPNNLSRADILARYDQVPLFQRTYTIQREPIANLAMDLTVPLLARMIGIFPAGKTFLVLVLAIYAAGCYLLCAKAQRGRSLVPLIVVCFFYNTAVATGFMNYTAGIAVYVLAFACWLRWRASWTIARGLAFGALSVGCYLAHLSSIVMLAVSVFSVCCWEVASGQLHLRTAWVSALAFVAPGALFVAFMRGPGRVGAIGWNSLVGKLQDLPLVLRTYSLTLDVVLVLVATISVVLWIGASRGVRVDAPTLVAAGALWICFIVAPKDLFTSNAVDMRFVWPASVLLAAAFRPRTPSRLGNVCVSAILLVWLFRVALFWSTWDGLGQQTAAIVRTFEAVPRGASVYPAFFAAGDFDTAKRDLALRHAACFAVVTRDAYVPTVSAMRAQQPIVQKAGLPFTPWAPGLANPWSGYDFVWTYKPPAELVIALSRAATPVARSGTSQLWRLAKPH